MANSDRFFKDFIAKQGLDINCSIFAKVDSYNNVQNTITAIPLTKHSNNPLPPLINVPVLFMSAGGYEVKFPIKKDDIVLILYLDYDTDNLLLDGETIDNNTQRTHALEDAVALPFTFNPFNNAYSAVDTFTIQDKNHGSNVKFTLDGGIQLLAEQDINLMVHDGSIKVSDLLTKLNDLESRVSALEQQP